MVVRELFKNVFASLFGAASIKEAELLEDSLKNIFRDGSVLKKECYKEGKLVKTTWINKNGSAVEYANGDKAWYLNGRQHRVDGPAVENINDNI